MNPFDLPGPQFLAVYTLFGAATLALVYQARQWAEAGEAGRVPMSDPYSIAYLRGGPAEVISLGVALLIDRQLLDVAEDVVDRHDGVKPAHGANEIERGILEECRGATAVRDLVNSTHLRELARRLCEPGLIRYGLIAGPDLVMRRQKRVVSAIAVLLAVAAIKVVIGVLRNRPVSFLVLMAIGFSLATFFLVRGFRTSRGDRVLEDLRTLFEGLRGRTDLRPNASTNELALLMAVFGLGAVPTEFFFLKNAFRQPRPTEGTNSCGGSGCGSSSSSCGGGGSDGGGGGCGGGGCGGCGS